MNERDAFDRWRERADKPLDNYLTIPDWLHAAVTALSEKTATTARR